MGCESLARRRYEWRKNEKHTEDEDEVMICEFTPYPATEGGKMMKARG